MNNRKPITDSFKYIDIDAINNKNQSIREVKIIKTTDAPSRASRAVFDGSVIFSLVRPYLKNIAMIDKDNSECIASTGFYVATSNGVFYPRFLYYLMISDYVIKGLNHFMKGDNSPSINKDDIEKWLYPVPPMHEQITISKYIDNCMELISNIEFNII